MRVCCCQAGYRVPADARILECSPGQSHLLWQRERGRDGAWETVRERERQCQETERDSNPERQRASERQKERVLRGRLMAVGSSTDGAWCGVCCVRVGGCQTCGSRWRPSASSSPTEWARGTRETLSRSRSLALSLSLSLSLWTRARLSRVCVRGAAWVDGQVDETVDVWECKNIIFMGCKVLSGSAKAIVIKTGSNTALGVVARVLPLPLLLLACLLACLLLCQTLALLLLRALPESCSSEQTSSPRWPCAEALRCALRCRERSRDSRRCVVCSTFQEMGWLDETAAPATVLNKMDKWESAFEGKTEVHPRTNKIYLRQKTRRLVYALLNDDLESPDVQLTASGLRGPHPGDRALYGLGVGERPLQLHGHVTADAREVSLRLPDPVRGGWLDSEAFSESCAVKLLRVVPAITQDSELTAAYLGTMQSRAQARLNPQFPPSPSQFQADSPSRSLLALLRLP
eukprot:1492606-Rhodomonas_salina.2